MNDSVNPEGAASPADHDGGGSPVLWLAPLLIAVAVIALAWGAIAAANRSPSGSVAVPPTTTSAPGGGSTTPPGDGGGGDGEAAARGEEIYKGTCVACHGPDAKGIPGLGKDLTNSEFIQGLTDDELIAFIKVGRPADDPENTTGVAMPPKGGNPSLSDQDIADVVAFLRTLQ